MKKYVIYLPLLVSSILFIGCSYNCSFANAQGTNSDLIDDTQTPTTTVRTEMSVPAALL